MMHDMQYCTSSMFFCIDSPNENSYISFWVSHLAAGCQRWRCRQMCADQRQGRVSSRSCAAVESEPWTVVSCRRCLMDASGKCGKPVGFPWKMWKTWKTLGQFPRKKVSKFIGVPQRCWFTEGYFFRWVAYSLGVMDWASQRNYQGGTLLF